MLYRVKYNATKNTVSNSKIVEKKHGIKRMAHSTITHTHTQSHTACDRSKVYSMHFVQQSHLVHRWEWQQTISQIQISCIAIALCFVLPQKQHQQTGQTMLFDVLALGVPCSFYRPSLGVWVLSSCLLFLSLSPSILFLLLFVLFVFSPFQFVFGVK